MSMLVQVSTKVVMLVGHSKQKGIHSSRSRGCDRKRGHLEGYKAAKNGSSAENTYGFGV